ncbi:MAG: TolB family protein, partial [Acidobacteriota bacterium]
MSIDRSGHAPRSSTGRVRTSFAAAIALLAGVAGALAVLALRSPSAPPSSPVALRLALPASIAVNGGMDDFGLALAPDGRTLVFPGSTRGRAQLWLLDLTTGDARALPATDVAVLPFWSPDGRSIAFFGAGRLRALSLMDGVVRDLAPAVSPEGGVWHPSGDIVFAPDGSSPLARRRGTDGVVEPHTTLNREGGETSHRHPTLVGGGRDLVYFVQSHLTTVRGLWLAPFERPAARHRLVGSDAHAVAVGDALAYGSGGALVAQRLDEATRTLIGTPSILGSRVGQSVHNRLFATAAGDVLVYGEPSSRLRELRWVRRDGTAAGTVGEPMAAWDVRLSPRGLLTAVARVDAQLKTLDIWTYEGTRPIPRRISPAIDADEGMVWSRDGARLAWISGRRRLTVRGAQAALPEDTLRTFDRPVRLSDWSPDGRWLVASQSGADTYEDVILIPAAGPGEPRAYADSPFNEAQGTVSPDGRLMAYASDESGQYEIYVDEFPTPRARARVS